MKKLNSWFELFYVKVVNVPTDGYCQFHSLYYGWCKQNNLKIGTEIKLNSEKITSKKTLFVLRFNKNVIHDPQTMVLKMRESIGKYIWVKEKRYSKFFEGKGSFKTFCQKLVLNDPTTWGNNVTLAAFCDLTGISVRIFQKKSPNKVIQIDPHNNNAKNKFVLKLDRVIFDNKYIHVLYYGNHYDVILSK